MVCTFFGHANAPKEIEPIIKSTLIDLIENKDVTTFYVGNHGNFDYMVANVLQELSEIYSIKYYVVLAYMPKKNEISDSHTLLPEEIELVHPKYAISWRNKWMIDKSDYVVAYVRRNFGGAYDFISKSKMKNKSIIYL